MSSTPGRNDLCSCGSGMKWKKCCAMRNSGLLPVMRHRQRVHLAIVGQAKRVGRKNGGALAAATHRAASEVAAIALRAAPTKHACSAGCSWCCSYKVATFGFEFVRVAHEIRASWSNERVQQLVEQLRQDIDRVAGLNRSQHAEAGVQCALLDRETRCCSVYESRPLACRTMFSPDAEICRQALSPDHNPDLAIPVELGGPSMQITFGVLDALFELRLDTDRRSPPKQYDFHKGLLMALTVPDAAERWARGEPVFDDAIMEADPSDFGSLAALAG